MHTITRVIGTAAMTAALGLGASALPASAATSAPASVSDQSWPAHNSDHNRCDRFDRWDQSNWWNHGNWWERCDDSHHRDHNGDNSDHRIGDNRDHPFFR